MTSASTDISFSRDRRALTLKTTHQVDKVLVADFSIRVAVGEGQQDFQFVGVQLGTMRGQKVPEALRTDEARIVWIVLSKNMSS